MPGAPDQQHEGLLGSAGRLGALLAAHESVSPFARPRQWICLSDFGLDRGAVSVEYFRGKAERYFNGGRPLPAEGSLGFDRIIERALRFEVTDTTAREMLSRHVWLATRAARFVPGTRDGVLIGVATHPPPPGLLRDLGCWVGTMIDAYAAAARALGRPDWEFIVVPECLDTRVEVVGRLPLPATGPAAVRAACAGP